MPAAPTAALVPGRSLATTGTPRESASRTTSGMPSNRLGNTRTSALLSWASTSVWSTKPSARTEARAPSGKSANAFCPGPTSTSSTSGLRSRSAVKASTSVWFPLRKIQEPT